MYLCPKAPKEHFEPRLLSHKTRKTPKILLSNAIETYGNAQGPFTNLPEQQRDRDDNRSQVTVEKGGLFVKMAHRHLR